MPKHRDELGRAVADARLDVSAGIAATSASLAMGAGPVPATIIGATGPAIKLAHRLVSRAQDRREDRAARALEQAAAILDVGLEILEERAKLHDDRLELLARVLEAAARTPMEEKITALARALADGLRDDGSVDEAFVIAAALTDIERVHVLLLRHLALNPVPPENSWPTPGEPPRGWDRDQLVTALPELVPTLDGILAVLEGHGLVRVQTDTTWAGVLAIAQRAITPIGRQCLFLLGENLRQAEE